MARLELYRCPECHGCLSANGKSLRCAHCRAEFVFMQAGIPDLTFPRALPPEVEAYRAQFDSLACIYDDTLAALLPNAWPAFRRLLVRKLDSPDARLILEIGVGTGRNFPFLWNRSPEAHLVGIDFSPAMVEQCAVQVGPDANRVTLGVANGEYLPFADGTFDAVLHFGFINEFSDPAKGLTEMVRVVKNGGRVVVSDDSVHPAMRSASWAQDLMRRNVSFACVPPVGKLPSSVANYDIEWFGGVFYVMALQKGQRAVAVEEPRRKSLAGAAGDG